MTKIEKILESIGGIVKDTVLLWEAIILSGYGASAGKIQKTKNKLEITRLREHETEKEKQKFYCLLNKLKKEGFIAKTKIGWKITGLGKIKLKLLKQKREKRYPEIIKDSVIKIIVFDIPEKERKKRDWLRFTLKNLEFSMLQRSVWIGKTILPKEFLMDIKKLNLTHFIQIFAISKTGTIQEVL